MHDHYCSYIHRISTYKRRSTSVSETDLSLRDELTPLEQKLLQSQELLEMRGKVSQMAHGST